MNDNNNEDRTRGSPAATARALALERLGGLLRSGDTDPRVLIQAAKLALWAADQAGDEASDDGFEIRFTGGEDGDDRD